MDTFRETAFYLTLWRTILITLVSVLCAVLYDLGLTADLLIGANVALIFSLWLIASTGRLTERHVARHSIWRTVPVQKRPPGEAGLRMARGAIEDVSLRFAKGAAGVAIVLAALAFVSNNTTSSVRADTLPITSSR